MENLIKRHLFDNIKCYILLCVFFILGAVIGSRCSFGYDSSGLQYMTEFFDTSINLLRTTEPDFNLIFKTALESSFKNVLVVWLLGFTVIGTLIITLIIHKCGFMLGFLTGFLIRIYGLKGAGAAFIIIISQCALYVPALIFISCMAASFSGTLFRMITGKIKYKTNFKYYILRYFCYFLVVTAILVFYALLEAYGGGNLIKLYLK